MRAAVYARVSTLDQEPENQLRDLREYCGRRGWELREYVDHGVSGAKERRPSLDRLLVDARRRRFDVVVVWRLDRLGRSLKHLITTLDEFSSLGVGFVSLGEGIDAWNQRDVRLTADLTAKPGGFGRIRRHAADA